MKAGKENLAEEYLKKCLVNFSGDIALKAEIILQYSKLIKDSKLNLDAEKLTKFTLDMITKASILLNDQVFNNLLSYLNFTSLSQDKKQLLFIQIYELKLKNGDNSKKYKFWLEFINYLVR